MKVVHAIRFTIIILIVIFAKTVIGNEQPVSQKKQIQSGNIIIVQKNTHSTNQDNSFRFKRNQCQSIWVKGVQIIVFNLYPLSA